MGSQPISVPELGALVLAAAALMGSPGPSTIGVTAVGAAFGLRRALPYVLGLVLGTCGVLLAVATGLHAILLGIPALAPVLTGASAGYICYLALRIAQAPPLAEADPAAPAPALWSGVALALANPKAWIAIAAVFAGSSLPAMSPMAAALLKTAVLAAMVVLIHFAWLFAGASLSRLLRNPAASRALHLGLAAALVLAGILAVLPR